MTFNKSSKIDLTFGRVDLTVAIDCEESVYTDLYPELQVHITREMAALQRNLHMEPAADQRAREFSRAYHQVTLKSNTATITVAADIFWEKALVNREMLSELLGPALRVLYFDLNSHRRPSEMFLVVEENFGTAAAA